MIPKPHYLGPEYASRFQDRSVVEVYHLREPYPEEVFAILENLITDEPRTVLDIGCGPGNIARRLVHLVERVDAVDMSLPMIEKGRSLPDGDHPNLNWMHGRVEDIALHPPYALVTAGQSMHWMEWDTVFPRFREVLAPNGYVALVDARVIPLPRDDDLRKIIKRFSTNPAYQPVDLIKELEMRGLFQKLGEKQTSPLPFVQSIDDSVESFHARSSLSREYMTQEGAAAFDAEVRALLSKYCTEGRIKMQVVGKVIWGKVPNTKNVRGERI